MANNKRIGKLEVSMAKVQTSLNDKVCPTLTKILDKVNALPCPVHEEKFKNLEKGFGRLWMGFVFVILGGIVLGVWLK